MEKHVIIGTAGHVDHGKTTLIRALTGVDTDRLKEEKERALSIELGFAPFDLPGGRRAGVVDVPGHRRFMGNMLAGISGIDLVLLVIDLQEGVMPQTREHLQVLDLLGIKRGIVVLTKLDLVEEEWVELMEEEVREVLEGTSFSSAPIVTLSAVTREGLPQLLNLIDEMVDSVESKDKDLPFRIYIDRVFTLKGFGTVITGTLKEGQIKEGEEAQILPQRKKMRIRQIQVHGEKKKEALAGQRVALNIPDLSSSQVKRGDVICSPSAFVPLEMIDARVHLIPDFQHSLKDNSRVHFHLGSSSVLARVSIHGEKELLPGESGYARFYFEEAIVGGYGDLFIIRFYSPVTTMGGGIVLDENPWRGKRETFLQDLTHLYEQKDPYRILYSLKKRGLLYFSDFLEYLHPRPLDLEGILSKLVDQGLVILLGKDAYLLKEEYLHYLDRMMDELEIYHQKNHLDHGIGKGELGETLSFPSIPGFNLFLDRAVEEGHISIQREKVSLATFSPTPTQREEELLEAIIKKVREGGVSPPSLKELVSMLKISQEDLSYLIGYLLRQGRLIKVEEGLIFHGEVLDMVVEKTVAYLRERGEMKANTFRDLLQTSRKYAIPLLEYLERRNVTKREGDLHSLVRQK